MVTPFKMTAFMPIQAPSSMMTGAVLSGGAAGGLCSRGRGRRCRFCAGRRRWVEVAVGDADVPGDEDVVADLDALFGHDERAVEEGEVADLAGALFADGEGDAGVAGDVVAEDDGAGRLLRMKRKICAVSRYSPSPQVTPSGMGAATSPVHPAVGGDVAHGVHFKRTKGPSGAKARVGEEENERGAPAEYRVRSSDSARVTEDRPSMHMMKNRSPLVKPSSRRAGIDWSGRKGAHRDGAEAQDSRSSERRGSASHPKNLRTRGRIRSKRSPSAQPRRHRNMAGRALVDCSVFIGRLRTGPDPLEELAAHSDH